MEKLKSYSNDNQNLGLINHNIGQSDIYYSLLDKADIACAMFDVVLDENRRPIDYTFISINKSFERKFGISGKEVIGKSIFAVFKNLDKTIVVACKCVALQGNSSVFIHYSENYNKHFKINMISVEKDKLAILFSDVTDTVDHKNSSIGTTEANNSYLCTNPLQSDKECFNFCDRLTGLFNRSFFSAELTRLDTYRRLPISVITADINGLKHINDSYGYSVGDEVIKITAQIIKDACRADEIIARIGGDEFAILLPNTTEQQAEIIVKRIKNLLSEVNIKSIDLSISFGWDTKYSMDKDLQTVVRNAENYMSKNKLFETPSKRSKLIDIIVKALSEKNAREGNHSNRVSQLCEAIGREMFLDDRKIDELKTIGLLHDIGKIAIDDIILNKREKLTQEEWDEIKRHPETGYNILSAANELSQLAEYVLAHQERWDGSGYPKGLKGKEIPLFSRILAVADAYDAMTNDRAYRKALTEEEAVEELRRNAGIQFDPHIVSVFLDCVLKGNYS